MITKAQVKHIHSLEDKKYRYKCNEFVVEGEKMLQELINSSLAINCIYATKDWIEKNQKIKNIHIEEVQAYELEKMSSLSTPNLALATVQIPAKEAVSPKGISLVLDRIQDPGNLGSIIRIADWFGIDTVYCSEDTVDVFNTKVVQASMGSVFRIKTQYVNIEELLIQYNIRKIGFLKIDTEGHDCVILGGLSEYLKNKDREYYPKKIQFESNHLTDPNHVDAIVSSFSDLGYTIESRGHDTILVLS
jgi:TrmH family RNA methyltransferase